jgi:hypothetical protein
MKCIRIVACVVLAATMLGACATQPSLAGVEMPGFLHGVLHGAIMPFSFIGSFWFDVRIYAFPNTGWPYDLGYMTGAALLGASIFTSA